MIIPLNDLASVLGAICIMLGGYSLYMKHRITKQKRKRHRDFLARGEAWALTPYFSVLHRALARRTMKGPVGLRNIDQAGYAIWFPILRADSTAAQIV